MRKQMCIKMQAKDTINPRRPQLLFMARAILNSGTSKEPYGAHTIITKRKESSLFLPVSIERAPVTTARSSLLILALATTRVFAGALSSHLHFATGFFAFRTITPKEGRFL